MKRLAPILAACLASAAAAQDFSAASEASSWNLYAEVPARFDARVVDVMCELTGDCPADCGAGARQLGLLRSADDVLVLATKNNQPVFSGAVVDLLPFCGQQVTVDGLMISDSDFPIDNLYLVQKIKAGDADWVTADAFTRVWDERNAHVGGDGPWFRRDPRVNAELAREGYLGLGLETDAAFIEDFFN